MKGRRFWNTTEPEFINYNSILLRDYFTIAATGNYVLLQLTGKLNLEKCQEAWEDIVKGNAEQNGNLKYFQYVDQFRAHQLLVNDYLTVRAMLIKLSSVIDMSVIKVMNTKGYRIAVEYNENGKVDVDKYEDSLIRASSVSQNLLTKIKMKQNELAKFGESKELKGSKMSFDAAMAEIVDAFKVDLRDDITLARYNEYRKRIRTKHLKVNNK